MGKSCRSGYGKGYEKATQLVRDYDWREVRGEIVPPEPPVETTTKREEAPVEPAKPPSPEPKATTAEPRLLVSLPVTVDDQEIYLQVFEGDDHTQKIQEFCDQYMADSAASCVSQLTPHVLKKL